MCATQKIGNAWKYCSKLPQSLQKSLKNKKKVKIAEVRD